MSNVIINIFLVDSSILILALIDQYFFLSVVKQIMETDDPIHALIAFWFLGTPEIVFRALAAILHLMDCVKQI